MRSAHSLLLVIPACCAAFAVVVASRAVVARARAEQPPALREPAGPTLAAFTQQRKNLEFSLRRLVEEGKWEAVEEEARVLLDLDPISEVARASLDRSRAERRAGQALAAALRLLDAGGEERALRALLAIPAGTEAHARARIEAEPLAERVARRARGDCLGLVKAGRLAQARERCRLHLDLVCRHEAEPALVERLRWLERRLGVPADEAWLCPGGAPTRGEGDPRVREILRAWERGEAGDHAALRMERLVDQGVAEARPLVEPMRRAEARLREGLAALLDGEIERARKALGRAAEAEREILGEGRSLRYRESVQRFGRLALERGLELESKRRFPEALRVLRQGAELDPSNTEILRALWRVEDISER